ncbi:UNVERIFIED_CONTAM: hypothetical protein HDU68_004720, partial [Siphonaria sp. JEL0065]
ADLKPPPSPFSKSSRLGRSSDDFISSPKTPSSSSKKRPKRLGRNTPSAVGIDANNAGEEVIVCKYVHEGPYRPKTALAREKYREFLASRAAEGRYRPDSSIERESFQRFLEDDDDYGRRSFGASRSLEDFESDYYEFSNVPVAKMEDFILKQHHKSSTNGNPKYANRRPETAIAKDFFRAFLAAKGEESRFRPDTALAKSHYRAFLSAKPDERILGMMGFVNLGLHCLFHFSSPDKYKIPVALGQHYRLWHQNHPRYL